MLKLIKDRILNYNSKVEYYKLKSEFMSKNPYLIAVVVIGLIFIGLVWYFGARHTPKETVPPSTSTQAIEKITSQPEETVPPSPSALPRDRLIQVLEFEDGPYLADRNRMTLYTTMKDEPLVSNCYDACAEAWPPFLLQKEEVNDPIEEVLQKIRVIRRADGSKQYTYDGKPLYYYSDDEKSQDINGHGKNNIWFVAGL